MKKRFQFFLFPPFDYNVCKEKWPKGEVKNSSFFQIYVDWIKMFEFYWTGKKRFLKAYL